MPLNEKYSILAPLSIQLRTMLAIEAVNFFSHMNQPEKFAIIGKEPPKKNYIHPFNGQDFQTYLEKTGKLENAGRYMFQIRTLLKNLEMADILFPVGFSGNVFYSHGYHTLKESTTLEKKGISWLTPALGPEFIRYYHATAIVQLTGKHNGDEHAGTGLIVSPRFILTCGHVIDDMTLDKVQIIQGKSIPITSAITHPTIDIGLIKTSKDMTINPGILMRQPLITERVFTIGYPRIPLTINPTIVMQGGEVTSESTKLLYGQEVFLYSAIARPGNSGGPIISHTGHVIGIVTQQLEEQSNHSSSPFHAGIDINTIKSSILELDPEVTLPVEDYQ